MSKETMKLALEALNSVSPRHLTPLISRARTALREALAKPDFWKGYVPEPVKPAQKRPQNCGTSYCSCIECVMEPAQQEPEYIVQSNGSVSPLLTHMMNKRVKSNVKQVIELYDSPEQPAQQEPVAWSSYEYDGIHHKPVAWMDADGNFSDNNDHRCFPIPLYTSPQPAQRTWQGLTDEEVMDIAFNFDVPSLVVRTVEAKLRSKNT